MPDVSLPCMSPQHAERSGEPDWSETTASVLRLPEGREATPEEMSAGGKCRACARLDPPPPPPEEPM